MDMHDDQFRAGVQETAVQDRVTTSLPKLLRPTWAEISLSKLRRNFEYVRRVAGTRRVMAVVKADAYGHGAVPIARTLDQAGADWFGVATVEEAVELRAAGIEKPVLLLGGLYMSDPADLIEYHLTPTVSSTARLDTYAKCAQRYGRPIEFHLKVDTGMGRLGLPPDRVRAFIERYRELPGLDMKGLFTHLASAEDLVASQTEEQAACFREALRHVQALGIEPEWIHVANSAALVAGSSLPENLVRIGGLLYGYCLPFVLQPGKQVPEFPPIEPILTLKSRVVYLKDVPSGTPLGYSAAFHTRRRSRIATVPVGYADGLSRSLSNRGRAIVRDCGARIVGNISMDLTLLDVTDVPGVDIGDEVTLLGQTDHCSITALEIAELVGTVPYEILCSIGRRVPRIYLDS
ncbi:MAG: alanine racemase [Acidobacteria bacterium]|nr:alanine racemase [Acidobacteriota bacterium]